MPQRGEPDPKLRAAIKEKLNKVRTKGYIQSGSVKSLTSFLSVPKGDNDIRIVYNGTQSGLNDCLWAPWFPLPTVEQHLRAVMPGTYMGDIDISEQFLNFMLHSKTQEYAGVDLTAYFSEECNIPSQIKQVQILWERWTRCAMGFKPSPYQACQGTLHAEELMRGDPLDQNNPFHFDTVILNLPGNADFCPWKPWVFKFRTIDQHIAMDLFIYVDDCRTTGFSFEETWRVARHVASTFNHLGIQDAPRKHRGPSQEPGAWAGSIVHTSEGIVTISISTE